MEGDISLLEILLRGGAVGAFAGLGIVCARGRPTPARVAGVLFCASAAAHTLTQYPPLKPALAAVWPIVWTFSVIGAGMFWAFATELFGDRRRLDPWRLAPAALLCAIALGANAFPRAEAFFWLAHNLFGAGLMAHVLFVVWSGWRNDLVEERRRLRAPLLAVGAGYAIIVVAVQSGEILGGSADALSPLAAATLFALGLASIGALLRADADLFAPGAPPNAPTPQKNADLSGADERLAGRLEALMGEDRLYRQEGLTIAALALKLGIPEHRLRRLINQQLGHRNFNAFLNRWRLADAEQALADPSQRGVPISTIALDAGFQSLGPFNRAFKAEKGMTPTEYRAQALRSADGRRA
jgi:AraC-like DNA-binding protein